MQIKETRSIKAGRQAYRMGCPYRLHMNENWRRGWMREHKETMAREVAKKIATRPMGAPHAG
jgi:hypothetical protein